MATEPKDEPEPEFETCPEIDEDFFKKMGMSAICKRDFSNSIHLLIFSQIKQFQRSLGLI